MKNQDCPHKNQNYVGDLFKFSNKKNLCLCVLDISSLDFCVRNMTCLHLTNMCNFGQILTVADEKAGIWMIFICILEGNVFSNLNVIYFHLF